MGGLIKLSNFAKLEPYLEMFGTGLVITIMLSLCTVVVGCVLGIILALMRMSDIRPLRFLGLDREGHLRGEGFLTTLSKFNPVSFLATAYVEILRSTPVIVQIAVIYYGIFGIINLPTFSIFGITKFHRFFPGVVAMGMNSGAYLCEIIRSGIQSIDGGQTEAARSLGMSQGKTLRHVVIPQAIRNILPAIANEFVVIIKESAVTYTIGVQDIMAMVQSIKGATYLIMEPLLVATGLYFCLCFPTSKLIAYVERRMSRGSKR